MVFETEPFQVVRDRANRLRIAGPRESADGLHRRVYDFWPIHGLAVCVCLDCWRAWPEDASLGEGYQYECNGRSL